MFIQVDKFWQSFLSLPQEQQDWEASQKLSHGISNYRLILPLFIRLHSKVWIVFEKDSRLKPSLSQTGD